jgi:hypothetical protein
MPSGKARGLLGESLKGADTTVSRLKAAGFSAFPLAGGRLGWGRNFDCIRAWFLPPQKFPLAASRRL